VTPGGLFGNGIGHRRPRRVDDHDVGIHHDDVDHHDDDGPTPSRDRRATPPEAAHDRRH
jgi:hypothetical protein